MTTSHDGAKAAGTDVSKGRLAIGLSRGEDGLSVADTPAGLPARMKADIARLEREADALLAGLVAFNARLRETGEAGKLVIIAAMRKLLANANAILARGAPWTPKTTT